MNEGHDQKRDALNGEIAMLRETCASLKRSVAEMEGRLRSDVDAVKTLQNYLYNQLCSDLDELREEVCAYVKKQTNNIEVNPITDATSANIK